MFRGVALLVLDVKFRLAIPARYRETISAWCAGRLVITADPSNCLLLYPRRDWEPIQEKLMALSSFNSRMRSLQRLLVGYAEDVEMDSAGRILLSSPLREFAALEKRVMLVGQGNKFEVWDEAKWATQRDHALEFRDMDIPGELEGFSL